MKTTARKSIAGICFAAAVLVATGCSRTVTITNLSDSEFEIGSSAADDGSVRVLRPGGTMDLRVRSGQRISFEGQFPVEISVR